MLARAPSRLEKLYWEPIGFFTTLMSLAELACGGGGGGGGGGGPTPPQTEKKLPKTIIFLSKKKLDLGQPLPLVETKSQLFPKHFGVCHMAPLLVEIVLNLVWLKAVYNGGGFWKRRDGERNPDSCCPIW